MDIQVARAQVDVPDAQNGQLDAKEVVTIVQHVVGELATDAVERAAAGAAAGNAARVAGLQHAVVAMVMRDRLASVRFGARERLAPHHAVPGMPYQLRPVLHSVL